MSTEDRPDQRLAEILAGLRRRQRAAGALRGAAAGVLAGSVGVFGALLARAVMRADLWAEAWWIVAVGLLGGAGVGAAVGAWRRPDELRLARALDRAASSQDRFASAMQLSGRAQPGRARLAVADALHAVRSASAGAAIPLRVPRSTRWAAAALAASLLVLVGAPGPRGAADASVAPELSDGQWDELSQSFREELASLREPETNADEEIAELLEQIASLLEEKPGKKAALAQIARVQAELERRERESGAEGRSAREASQAIARSRSLKEFADMLAQGEYAKAARSLSDLAGAMDAGSFKPSALQLDNVAADMADLAKALGPNNRELSDAAKRAADAAAALDSKALAEAMKRMAEQMNQQAARLGERDRAAEARRLLEQLRRRMNKMHHGAACSGGAGPGNVLGRPGAGRGGSKAGWGSVESWARGALADREAGVAPDLVDPPESAGAMTSLPMVSSDEDAESARSYEEVFADMVKQAEAELDLESAPHAYRDYLRRYFNAIKPGDDDEAAPAPE